MRANNRHIIVRVDSVGGDYVTSSFFNDATGDLVLTRISGGTVTTNLDGRYVTSATDSQTLSWSATTNQLEISNGNIVTISGFEESFSKNTAFNKNFTTTLGDIKMNGNQSLGVLTTIARADHIHPTDSTRAPLASPIFTGIVTIPDLTLNSLSVQASEATSLMINGSGVVGTRELGANAFNSTTIPTVTPSALTKGVDDTNITLTLSGSPTTALLAATSITVDWTGTLADSRITSAGTWNAKAPTASPTFTGIVTTPDLTLTSLSNQASEATALMINGSNVVGTRELGSNAFNSTPIPSIGTLASTSAIALPTSASESFSGAIALHKISKTGTYSDLIGKPSIPSIGTLITNNTVALTPSSGEAFSGTINLHEISKTGDYGDLENPPSIPSAANNATITLTAGSGLSTGGNFTTNQSFNETITINHSNSITAGNFGDSGATRTLTHGDTFKNSYVTYDAQGHITGATTKTLTLPGDNNTIYSPWKLRDGDTTVVTVASGQQIDLIEGDDIDINWTDITGPTYGLTFDHKDTTRGDTTSTTSPAHGGTFTAVDSLLSNARGHVTGINVKTVTLPAGAVPNNATITLTAGVGLSTGGNFTTDQGTNETITINVDYLGTDNFMWSAPLLTSPATDDYIIYHDVTDNNVKRALISSMPFNNNAAANNATITISAGTDLNTGGAFTTDQSGNETITINHDSISRTDTTSTQTATHGGTFTAVDSVTSVRGHVTAINVKTVTLPGDNNTNWYPTAFAWTNGTTAGPTGSLTGVGMTAVGYGAIPSASGTISGIVTTGVQTWAGRKTFSGGITATAQDTWLGETKLNGEISSGSSAKLQVNGFQRTGNIYLHQGGNTPTTAGELIISNVSQVFTVNTGASFTGTMAATTVTGANVTSGADPGHTHTAYGTGDGTVTSITVGAGTGLTGGGTITTSGTVTLNVIGGTGITANANDIALTAAGAGAATYGSTADATKIDTITLDAYGRVTAVVTGPTGDVAGVTAGNGLTGGGTSGTPTITMGTPGTSTTSNAVTSTSHTHAIGTLNQNTTGSSGTVTHNQNRTDTTEYPIVWATGSPSPLYSVAAITIKSNEGKITATALKSGTPTEGCEMKYNSTSKTLDFIFD